MAETPRHERTEKPTPKALRKAREQGRVARSPEVTSAFVLGGFLVFAQVYGPAWVAGMKRLLATTFAHLDAPDLTPSNLVAVLSPVMGAAMMLLLPPLGALKVAGLAGEIVQATPTLTLEPLSPRFNKLNPMTGLRRLISLTSLVEVVKTLIKLTLYSAVAWYAARTALVDAAAGSPGAEGAFQALVSLGQSITLRILVLAAFLAGLDLLYRKWDHVRGLRMTKRQVRDERREQEGDPLIKARMRSKQMSLARSRMMADVPKATVVVTNPTHYAVALRYVPAEMDVPKLLAKGRGKLAARIREIAEASGVPIVSDPPLARSLYKSIPVGGSIPPALYRAVAEVLAMVLGRRARRGAMTHRAPEMTA